MSNRPAWTFYRTFFKTPACAAACWASTRSVFSSNDMTPPANPVPVTSVDVLPTLAEAAGLAVPANVDGRSLLPLLKGAATLDREAIFWHYPHYNSHPSSVPSSVIRKGDWKLIETFDPEGIELYNLADDLSEKKNLAAEQTSKVDELRRELEAWRKDVGAEMMEPNPDYEPKAAVTKKKKKN